MTPFQTRHASDFTSGSGDSISNATRFGWGSRVPFLSRVLPAGKPDKKPTSRSFLTISSPNILLVSSRPSKDGSGVILHLRELEGLQTSVNIKPPHDGLKIKSIAEVNVLEETKVNVSAEIRFKPFEVKFIKLTL